MDRLRKDIEECKTKEQLYDLLRGCPDWVLLALRPIILRRFHLLE